MGLDLRQAPPTDRPLAPTLLRLTAPGPGTGPTVVFFPDFGGSTIYARALVENLGRDVRCLALRFSPDMVAKLDGTTIEDIGARFAEDIAAAQMQGPVHLFGHSFAGCLAYETAQRMALAGHAPDGLWLADLARFRKLDAAELLRRPVSHAVGLAGHLGRNWRRLILGQSDPLVLVAYGVWRIDLSQHPEAYRYIIRSMYRALLGFVPRPSAVPTTLLRAAEELKRRPWGRDLGWSDLVTGPFRVEVVPGDHLSMMRLPENAAAMAALMRRAMRQDSKDEVSGER